MVRSSYAGGRELLNSLHAPNKSQPFSMKETQQLASMLAYSIGYKIASMSSTDAEQTTRNLDERVDAFRLLGVLVDSASKGASFTPSYEQADALSENLNSIRWLSKPLECSVLVRVHKSSFDAACTEFHQSTSFSFRAASMGIAIVALGVACGRPLLECSSCPEIKMTLQMIRPAMMLLRKVCDSMPLEGQSYDPIFFREYPAEIALLRSSTVDFQNVARINGPDYEIPAYKRPEFGVDLFDRLLDRLSRF